jgi:hypothetical protein
MQEHNAETEQRLGDYKMELAVWPDAPLGQDFRSRFEALGAKCLGRLPKPTGKRIDFSGLNAKLVGHEANDGAVHAGDPADCPVCSKSTQ